MLIALAVIAWLSIGTLPFVFYGIPETAGDGIVSFKLGIVCKCLLISAFAMLGPIAAVVCLLMEIETEPQNRMVCKALGEALA